VHAEVTSAFIAVEERRKDLEWQRCGGEQRVARELAQHDFPELARHRVLLRELQVVFHLRRLRAGCRASVVPFGTGERRAEMRDLVRTQNVGDLQQHALQNLKFTVARYERGMPVM